METIYAPQHRKNIGFFGCYRAMFDNIVSSKDLIRQLFIRDFFATYKKSYFGIGWVLVSPLVTVASWVFMSFTGVLNPGSTGIPYPVYVLLSTSIWTLFIGFYTAGETTLSAGEGFINQVKYPHESLLIKQTAQHLANFVVSFALNLILFVSFGVTPSWKMIFAPAIALPLFFLGSGVGLVVSVIGVVSLEAQKITTIFFQFLIFLTPVIYANRVQNAMLQKIIDWNPLTYLVGSVREIIFYGTIVNPTAYVVSAGLSLFVFLLSLRLFFVSEETVIEKMI